MADADPDSMVYRTIFWLVSDDGMPVLKTIQHQQNYRELRQYRGKEFVGVEGLQKAIEEKRYMALEFGHYFDFDKNKNTMTIIWFRFSYRGASRRYHVERYLAASKNLVRFVSEYMMAAKKVVQVASDEQFHLNKFSGEHFENAERIVKQVSDEIMHKWASMPKSDI